MLAHLWMPQFSVPIASLVTSISQLLGFLVVFCFVLFWGIYPRTHIHCFFSLSLCSESIVCTEQPLGLIPQRLRAVLSCLHLSRNSVKICPIKPGNQEQQVLVVIVTINRWPLWCKSNTGWGLNTESGQSLIPVSISALRKDHLPPRALVTPCFWKRWWDLCGAESHGSEENCWPEAGIHWVTSTRPSKAAFDFFGAVPVYIAKSEFNW